MGEDGGRKGMTQEVKRSSSRQLCNEKARKTCSLAKKTFGSIRMGRAIRY